MTAGQAILYALFTWYLSTGVILYLDGLPTRTFRWSLLGATAVLAAALCGLAACRGDASPTGAAIGFTCGVGVWAWQEMAFLMGFVTGPRRQGCTQRGWAHFRNAVAAVLYHELAILAGGALVVAAAWGGVNQVGVWTYMILWGMRLSAKFNVFLGVRNLNEELLPAHLAFLQSYLTRKWMNPLFPVSVLASTILAGVLMQRAAAPDADAFTTAGYALLATMTVLALVEHWFLVLPLPFAQLWRWGMRSHRAARALLTTAS